ncbi:hypothetical protein CAPTEDRAFT_203750 [Capitella teleta]|uniref:Uncharacterized protein n=1 Tax=Capitella teleta TaxID=283909 RepID=R7VJJ9_CAPTE|nr:hypothetical protein CAPTEDRAFT_203750 [Capitella teleta]|eukprot:ELU16556.1 hypothetical protein CAPTEDRAFT_203750 [Capitella teleta]
MPPAIAAVGAAFASAAAAVAAFSVTTWVAIAGVAMAGVALLNKPKMPGSGTSPSDRKQVIRSPASSMVGVIGKSQLGGVLTFAEERKSSSEEGDDELNLIITIAGHTQAAGTPVIKSVNKVFMDDREVPLGSSHSGKVFIRVYDGSQQKIDDIGTELTGLPSWRNDMIGKGICFAHVRLRFDQELFPSGVPNFVFEVDSVNDGTNGWTVDFSKSNHITTPKWYPAVQVGMVYQLRPFTLSFDAIFNTVDGVQRSGSIVNDSRLWMGVTNGKFSCGAGKFETVTEAVVTANEIHKFRLSYDGAFNFYLNDKLVASDTGSIQPQVYVFEALIIGALNSNGSIGHRINGRFSNIVYSWDEDSRLYKNLASSANQPDSKVIVDSYSARHGTLVTTDIQSAYIKFIDDKPVVNPSLSSDATLTYLQQHFGAKEDEIDFESFDITRPICAEMVATGDGKEEPRYTANGAFNFDEPHKQVIDKIRVTAAGKLTYLYGKFGFQVGAYNGPADFVLTEDDIIGDVSVKPQPDRRSLINTCKGKHVWPEGKFQEVDFPQVYSETMLADDGEELTKDLDLEFCHSPYQCQRLAANDIARARLPVITVPCNWRAFECHLGRNIKLHMPSIGFDHKECVVEGWELDPERGVTLTLREDSPTVWTDIIGKVPILPPDVNLPDPTKVAPVTNIQMNELEVDNIWEVRVSWQHANPSSIYEYQVLIEKEVNSQWVEKLSANPKSQQVRLNNPESGNYRATIVAINRFDVKSPAAMGTFTCNVPEVTLTGIAANVDNSVYPASALIVAEVQGAASFPAESIVYETECKTVSTQWLAAGRGTAASCRLSSLDAGVHSARMRAIPPYGKKSEWLQTEFEVFAADQPTELTFTADPSFDRWGFITWAGAGQSWEVTVADSNNQVLWNSTTTERLMWLDWLKPGLYNIAVRARAGAFISGWSSVSQLINELPAPTDLTFDTSNASPGSTGTLNWQTSDGRPQTFDVEVLSDGIRIYASPSYETNEPLPLLLPGTYQFRVRSRWNGQVSGWTTISFGYELAPADIDDLQLRALGNQAVLSWAKPAEDIYGAGFVQIRYTPKTGSNATWETASRLADRLTGNTTSISVALLNGTYLIKAVNSQGLWSDNAAAVVSNMADSIGYNRILVRDEPTTWPGDKNKASITGSVINLQDDASNNQPPSYTMEQPLDLGGVFTVRLQMEADGSVYEQDLIDDRLDPIDDWPQFDGEKPGNTTLQYFVSRTEDDPASPTANWSPWTEFVLGEFRSRAFKLQVQLLTDTPVAVGTISGLKLLADVPDRQEQQENISIPAAAVMQALPVPATGWRSATESNSMANPDYHIDNLPGAQFRAELNDTLTEIKNNKSDKAPTDAAIANLQTNKLDKTGTAADSAKLGGIAPSGYALKLHSHTADDLPTATLSAKGVVQLLDNITSASTVTAATPNAVRLVNDKAVSAYDLAESAKTTADAAYPKAGGDLAGTINYTPDTGNVITLDNKTVLYRHTAAGAISFGADEAVVIGSGESRSLTAQNVDMLQEVLHLSSDGQMVLRTNLNGGWSSRQEFVFETDGGSITSAKCRVHIWRVGV